MSTHITAILWLNDTLGKRHLLIVGGNYCNVDAVDYGRQSDTKVVGGSGMEKLRGFSDEVHNSCT
jgi:hypothetical protein